MRNSPRLDTELKLPVVFPLTLVCLCLTGCDQEKIDTCEDAPPPLLEMPAELGEEVLTLAEISVDEWVEKSRDGKEDTGGMLAAYFADLTNLDEEKIPVVAFGEACVGEVGRHVIHESPRPLTAASVMFRGLMVGKRSLEKNDAGIFDVEIISGSIFSEEGGENVEVEVESAGGADSFQNFVLKVTIPPEIRLVNLEHNSDWTLDVEWEPATSSYFEITATALNDDPGLPKNRLKCLLEDDGCHVIPAEAMEWLLSQGSEEVTVILKRHVLAHDVPADGALAEIDVIRSMENKLFME